MSKSELISLRLKPEDIAFISALGADYGATTSEKIRTLIRSKQKEVGSKGNLAPIVGTSLELSSKVRKSLQAAMMEYSLKSDIFDIICDLPTSLLAKLQEMDRTELSEKYLKSVEEYFIGELQNLAEKYCSMGLSNNPRVLNNRSFLDSLISINSLLNTVEEKLQTKVNK